MLGRFAEKGPVAASLSIRIGTAVVRLAKRPADALTGLRLVPESQEDVQMRVRPAASGRVAIPADVEPIRLVTLVQQRTRLSKQLEGRIDLVRGELEDGWSVCLRDDHAATAEKLPFQILGVEEHAEFVLQEQDSPSAESIEIAECATHNLMRSDRGRGPLAAEVTCDPLRPGRP